MSAETAGELLDADERALLRPARSAQWRQPELATLTDRHFSDPGWVYEPKLDGVRALATRDGGEPRLWSRNRKGMESAYPEIVEALAGSRAERFVLDGEVVAFSGERTSFARLQHRIHLTDPDLARRSGVAVYYYVFDLLVLDDVELAGLPLRARKRVLWRAFDFADPIRYCQHRDEAGERYLREACGKGWEGVIAKRADRAYRGGRSANWLKFKCVAGQEFVVGGFTEPRGSRTGFGALLVGYYRGARLRYAGKVGTGYSTRTLRDLRARLGGMERDTSPFDDPVAERDVHWVRPEVVAEVGFAEWTGDGRLRHPRYLGLRTDKEAREVVRER